jgi:hypothetical protein
MFFCGQFLQFGRADFPALFLPREVKESFFEIEAHMMVTVLL